MLTLDSFIRNINNSYELENDINKIRNYIMIGNKITDTILKIVYFTKMMNRIKDGFNIKIEEELLTSFKKNKLKLSLTNYAESDHLLNMLKRIKIKHQTNKYKNITLPNFNNVKIYVSIILNRKNNCNEVKIKLPLIIEIYKETIENVYKQLYPDRIFIVNYDNSRINADVEINGKIKTIDISLSEIINNDFFL